MIYREPSVSARSPRARFFHDSIQWEDRIHSGFWWTCYRGANSWREDDIFISFVASIQPHIGPPSIDPIFEIKKKKKYKKERRKRKVRYTRPNRIGRLQTRFLARFFAGQKIDYFSDCFFFYFRRSNNLTIALLQEFANPAKESLFDDIGGKRLPRHRLL